MNDLESLRGYINGEHNFNILTENIRMPLWLQETQKEKRKELLEKVVKEGDKKGLTVNCNKTERVVTRKKDRLRI